MKKKPKKLGQSYKQSCIHVLGDFNYRKINCQTKLNKVTNTCLNGSDNQVLNEDDCAEPQKDIDTLGNWATNWGIRFQPVKCNMMTLSCKKKITSFKYTLKNTELQFLTSIKYLGVNITNDLHLRKNIEELCNKSYGTSSACLLESVIEYTNTAWDPHQLENVQKRAARFITSNYNYKPGSMTAILDQLHLPDRRTHNRLILFCKSIHGQANLPSDLLKKTSMTTKNMHSEHVLRTQTKTDTLKYSFRTTRYLHQNSDSRRTS